MMPLMFASTTDLEYLYKQNGIDLDFLEPGFVGINLDRIHMDTNSDVTIYHILIRIRIRIRKQIRIRILTQFIA
jgi:hypothetical protein